MNRSVPDLYCACAIVLIFVSLTAALCRELKPLFHSACELHLHINVYDYHYSTGHLYSVQR